MVPAPGPGNLRLQSYCSFPVYLADGRFFGTLCAIDPNRRKVSDEAVIEMFTEFAREIGRIISQAMRERLAVA